VEGKEELCYQQRGGDLAKGRI